MDRKVLINVGDTDVRVAFLEEGKLVGLQIEPYNDKSIVGNIYKGRVESIVPGLKALFVNIGMEKNAFLHFSDVHGEYVLPSQGRPSRLQAESHPSENGVLTVSPTGVTEKKAPRKKGGPVPLEVGHEILVQVTKDEINDKGPRITTYVSLPGRYLVFMPFSENEGGVSRRIENEGERKRLRTILKDIQSLNGSFIVRTAGLEQAEEAIKADVQNLVRQWKSIERKTARSSAPCLLHNDHDIFFRIVRDSFAEEGQQIIIDDAVQGRQLQKTVNQLMPNSSLKITTLDKPKNLFESHDVEKQIQKALKNKVWLRSGGYLVIEETEAMTAIDVNTGKFVGRGDQEETILKTNMEAAAEVVSQLRVRDIGGLIVVDFIDMASKKNRATLLREVGNLLKLDRAKSSFTDISEFGLVQITRKRVRQSLSKTLLCSCPYCEGNGRILNNGQIWKNIRTEISRELETSSQIDGLEITVHPQIRRYLEDELLDVIKRIANEHKITLKFVVDESLHIERFKIIRHVKKEKVQEAAAPQETVTPIEPKKKPQRRQRGSRGGRRPRKREEKTLETVSATDDNPPTTSP